MTHNAVNAVLESIEKYIDAVKLKPFGFSFFMILSILPSIYLHKNIG